MVSGPIVIIEDDADDKAIFEEVLRELGIPNQLIWFVSCEDAYHFLATSTAQPFIIFSDINLPGLSGLDFKKKVDNHEQLRKKSIPFVLYSSSARKKEIDEAYNELMVQGFFQKLSDFKEMKNLIRTIMAYWKLCKHPNSD